MTRFSVSPLAAAWMSALVTVASAGCGDPVMGSRASDGDASAGTGADGSGTTTETGAATPGTDGSGATAEGGARPGADGAVGGPAADAGAAPGDGGPSPGFWDAGVIPPAQNVMTFVFLNRTNGHSQDTEVYWRFTSGAINEVHAIADQRTYDMPANSSGRMYFYLCAAGDAACAADPTKSPYFDFIEHTIGASQYNGNTTRVDAFGLKIAMRLHCADGYDVAVGEDYATFLEDRATTFQKFVDAVPAEFKPLAQPPHAPYRIVQPGAGGFGTGGANATYYDSFADQIWAANGLTIPKPGPNGSGLAAYPSLSAAIFRHVGAVAGTFDPTGKLLDQSLWSSSATFYAAAPADYYAMFWHAHALGGRAYGFPYDDVGGYSSYISHANPQYMLVAIGW